MASKKNTASLQPLTKHQEFLVGVEIGSTAPIIQHNFSQKSVEEMLKKHMGFACVREPKKPRDLLEQATIRNTEGVICIPPTSFKKGMLEASLPIKGLVKKRLRGMLWVEGGSIPFKYSKMVPRMDIVRLPNGMPDVRFRPMFLDWSARLLIGYSEALQVELVIDLLNRAGRTGVGEWRPERDGTFGTYKVIRNITSQKELEEVREECKPQLQPLVIPDWAMDVELDDDLMKKIAASDSVPSADMEEGSNEETSAQAERKSA